ncbi:MAG: glycosyltransferase family 39 protein [Anaerolineae bacterium]
MRLPSPLKRRAFLLLAIVLLAFALRSFRLANQSIWYDEGLSVYYARQSLPALLAQVSASDHPPLYFLLLHWWLPLAGRGEFAVRFLSLGWGVLLIPLIYRLGLRRERSAERRWLLGPSVALLAALLIALSPFHIWYAQEARMYTLATFLSALSSYLLLRALTGGRRTRWLAYALATLAAVYAHFYTLFILAFHAAFVLWWAWRERQPRPLAAWGLCQGVVLLAFLPWGRFAVEQLATNDTYWRGTLDLKAVLTRTLLSFSVGETLEGPIAKTVAVVYLLLVPVGVWALLRSKRRGLRASSLIPDPSFPNPYSLSFLLLYLLIPIVALLLLSYNRPKFAPRYLLLATPAFYLLAAQGLGELARPTRWAWVSAGRRGAAALSLALVLTGAGLSLSHHYFDPTYAKPDFRAVARYIRDHAEPRDAVVMVGGHAYPAFAYYQEELATYLLPPQLLPTVTRPLDAPSVAAALNDIVAQGHDRVWLILWQEELADPRRLVLNQLLSHGQRLTVGEDFHGLALLLFDLEPGATFVAQPQIQHLLLLNFADQLELVGYDLDRKRVQAGEMLNLKLYWQAQRDLDRDYTAFTHLLSQGEHIYGQLDRRLGGDFYPSSRWPVGEVVQEEYPIVVLPGTPPGRYPLEVGLYLRSTMERLPILGQDGEALGDRYLLTEVEVTKALLPLRAFDIQHPLEIAAGELTLLGFDLEREALRPGQALHLTLYWQAVNRPRADHALALRLVTASAREEWREIVLQQRDPLADGMYPPILWDPGEIVRDIHSLFIPAQLPPGRYEVEMRLLPDASWVRLPQPLTVR